MTEKECREKREGLEPSALTEQRDEAVRELVRALLIINGGGAAALLAFLQAIWSQEKDLAKPIIVALLILSIGAGLAAAFHLFRHQASWYHQKGNMKEWEKFRRFYLVSASVSLAAFFLGIGVVAGGAWCQLP